MWVTGLSVAQIEKKRGRRDELHFAESVSGGPGDLEEQLYRELGLVHWLSSLFLRQGSWVYSE